jgi:DNA-binding winged helix-turn-helix (wHTH) protein/tetratricopeptide (TPR) repeat protein
VIDDLLLLGDVRVDLATRRVLRPSGEVGLTPLEHSLLMYLIAHAGRVVTQGELLEAVWELDASTRTATVYATVNRLRKKVEPDPASPRHIVNQPGAGYRFQPPEDGPTGRSTLLAELRVLTTTPGLVVLRGPGGIGKSTLARAWLGEEGVWIDLSHLRAAEEVVPAVADAIGSDLVEADAEEQLLRALARRPFVLDDLERIRGIHALLARWVALAPELTGLATTRIPLDVGEELEVPPLDRAASEQVLVERAATHGVQVDGPLDDVLDALDGHPLSLVLAGDRLRQLTPADLGAALQEPVTALSPGADRQTSLSRCLDLTWEALDASTRELAIELTVFAGPFGYRAASAVSGRTEVLSHLDALRAHGLLRVGADRRFTWLAPIRAFVASRGSPPDEIRRRHASWFAGLVAHSDDEERRLAALRDARPDLRHALQTPGLSPETVASLLRALVTTSLRSGPVVTLVPLLEQALDAHPAVASDLLEALLDVYDALGRHREALETAGRYPDAASAGVEVRVGLHRVGTFDLDAARATLQAVRQRVGEAEAALAAYGLGLCAWRAGDPAEGERWLEEAVDGYRAIGDAWGAARAELKLAALLLPRGRRERAEALFRAAEDFAMRTGDHPLRAAALLGLANILSATGQTDRARTCLETARELARDSGNRAREAAARYNLGTMELLGDRFDAARVELEQALALYRAVGDRRSVAMVCNQLGSLERAVDDPLAARRRLAQGHTLAVEGGWQGLALSSASALALVAAGQGEHADATAWIERARQAAVHVDMPIVLASLACRAAAVAKARGDVATSEAERARAIELATEAGQERSARFAQMLAVIDTTAAL